MLQRLAAYVCMMVSLACHGSAAQKEVQDALKRAKEMHKRARSRIEEQGDVAIQPSDTSNILTSGRLAKIAAARGRVTEHMQQAALQVTALKNEELKAQELAEQKALQSYFDQLMNCAWNGTYCNAPLPGQPFECARLLNGCISDLCDPDDLTAKLLQAMEGPDETWPERSVKAAAYLCAGAKKDIMIHGFVSPLILGILHNDARFVKHSLAVGADPNARTRITITDDDRNSAERTFQDIPGFRNDTLSAGPLHWAVMSGRKPELVKLLIDAGAEIASHDTRGFSPLRDLAYHCHSYTSPEPIVEKANYLLAAKPTTELITVAMRHARGKGEKYAPCAALADFFQAQVQNASR